MRNAKELLERLERERSCIDKRIAELKEHIARLGIVRDDQTTNNGVSGSGRRRKGENMRTVLALYEREPEAALTKQEIATRTGLSFSSVQSVLDRKDAGFVMEGGLWRRKQTGP
jgi:hypothetical protein